MCIHTRIYLFIHTGSPGPGGSSLPRRSKRHSTDLSRNTGHHSRRLFRQNIPDPDNFHA